MLEAIRKSRRKAIMKRQKKGEAALLVEGVKQSYPGATFGSPVARIITQNSQLYNRTSVHIGASEVAA
jgi:hypothetical protein